MRGFQGGGKDGYGGDVMITVADLSAADLGGQANYQTQDAARDWQIGATWEPVSERMLVFDQHTDLTGQTTGLAALQGGAHTSADKDLFAIEVPLGMDLSVSATKDRFSDAHPVAGEEVVITATIRNLGLEGIEQPFDLFLQAGADVLIDVTFEDGLGPNGAYELVTSWTTPGGRQEVRLAVDDGRDGGRA